MPKLIGKDEKPIGLLHLTIPPLRTPRMLIDRTMNVHMLQSKCKYLKASMYVHVPFFKAVEAACSYMQAQRLLSLRTCTLIKTFPPRPNFNV